MRFLLTLLLLALLGLPALAQDDPGHSSEPPTAEEMTRLLDSPDKLIEWRERADRVLQAHPDSFAGHMLMGFVLHRSEGDLPRSRYHLNKAKKGALSASDGGDTEAWQFYNLALFELRLVLGEMDLYEEQIEVLDEYSRVLTGNVLAAEYAWPLMKLEREVEAREKLSQAFNNGDPNSRIVAWNSLGALEMEVGNAQASYDAFQKLIEESEDLGYPMDCTYLRNAGEAALALGRYDEAERYFKESTQVPFNDQTFSNPYWDLTGLYLTQGRYPEALQTAARMQQWSRAIKPFLYQQSMADNQQRIGELLLELGYLDEAVEQLEVLVQKPDRRGGTSGDNDQAEAGNLMIWRNALLAKREAVGEKMARSRGMEWWKLWWEHTELGLKARTAGRRVAALAVANDRVQGSLRPYWAGSILMGEWHRPDLVELYGAGVSAAALKSLRENPPEKLPLEEPFLEAIDAEIATLGGDRSGALAHLDKAIATLPDSEVLMKIRLHARAGQLLEQQGDRPAALAHFEQVLEKAPGMLRAVRARLPVAISGDTNSTMSRVASMIGRSPRFRRASDGLPLQLDLAGNSLQATLLTRDGTVLARASAPLKDDMQESAAALVDELHRQAFSPKIDLSQGEMNSLDGSNLSGSTASDRFKELFQEGGQETGPRI